jgi:hypothetical protein
MPNLSKNPMKSQSTNNTVEYTMNAQYQVTFTYAELRAVIKSLNIGCDQLTRKLERMSSTQYHSDVEADLKQLVSASQKLSTVMYDGLQGGIV